MDREEGVYSYVQRRDGFRSRRVGPVRLRMGVVKRTVESPKVPGHSDGDEI